MSLLEKLRHSLVSDESDKEVPGRSGPLFDRKQRIANPLDDDVRRRMRLRFEESDKQVAADAEAHAAG